MSLSNANWCQQCKKGFSKTSNLRAHIRRKHPDNQDDLIQRKLPQPFVCSVCNKRFANKCSLKFHVKHKHSGDNNAREIDQESNKTMNILECPLCEYRDHSGKRMTSHYKEIHDIAITVKNHEFSCFDDFKFWKEHVEKDSVSSFITSRGTYNSTEYTKKYYVCHRSGPVRHSGIGKKHMKIHGSKKINGFCPAGMTVTVEGNGRCFVLFCETHVGHKNELGHLFLKRTEQESIAAKIANKVPFQSILDDIRDSFSNDHLETLNLLTKTDLLNIECSFNLNRTSVCHANDAVSLEAWVREMSGSVLLYKAQGDLCEGHPQLTPDDFALIIMTQGQKELLKNYGNDTICIDGTHSLNGYGFEMHTLLVLDDLREGYPCSFLISNRSDEEIMKIFFLHVKEAFEDKIRCRVFMSDMAEIYYSAWVQIMELAEFRLFCTWHVDRAWRKNLSKVATQEKKAAVYKMLQTLLHERDIQTFSGMVEDWIMILKVDPQTSDFGDYFENYYLRKASQWAYCYRLKSGLNTNMHIERMHHSIKYLYLHGKFIKRLDKAITAIMKFVRDRSFNRIVAIHKDKLCTKLKELRIRHNAGADLSTDVVVQTEAGWNVPSSSNEIYDIQEMKKECACQLTCTKCKACMHMYSCSCIDSCIRWNMCKHIHLVCRYRNPHAPELLMKVETADTDENKLCIDLDPQVVESAGIVAAESRQQRPVSTVETEKQKIVEKFMHSMNSVTTMEEVNAVKRMLAPMEPTLEALRSSHGVISKLEINSVPTTKNIDPQRWLFLTRMLKKNRTK